MGFPRVSSRCRARIQIPDRKGKDVSVVRDKLDVESQILASQRMVHVQRHGCVTQRTDDNMDNPSVRHLNLQLQADFPRNVIGHLLARLGLPGRNECRITLSGISSDCRSRCIDLPSLASICIIAGSRDSPD